MYDACWRTGCDGLDMQPDHGGAIALVAMSVACSDGPELELSSFPKKAPTSSNDYTIWSVQRTSGSVRRETRCHGRSARSR